MHKTSAKNFGDQGKEITSSQAGHQETKKANQKFKILGNITLVKACRQDDEDQNTMRKSNAKLNKQNKREKDEAHISDTESFLNYCNSYILKTRSTSSDSSLSVIVDNKDNEITGLPDGRKNKVPVNKNRRGYKNFENSSSDSSTDNNKSKNKITSLTRNSKKQDDRVNQSKKKLFVKNEVDKKSKRKNSWDSSSDNNKGNEMSRFPEDNQMRKRGKLIEKNRIYKRRLRRDRSSSSSSDIDDMPNQSKGSRNKAQAKKKRRLNENGRNYSFSNSSSINNNKENEVLRFLGAYRKKSNCVEQVKKKAKNRSPKRKNSSDLSPVYNDNNENNEILNSPESATNRNHPIEVIRGKKLNYDSDSNSSTARPSVSTKRLCTITKISFDGNGNVGAVTSNKKTKPALNDINRIRQTRVSFSSESSLENGENVIHVINKHKISNKFSDESSVFSSSSNAKEFSNICVDFHVMDESARHQKVTEFLRKWCPCDEDIDVMTHIKRAKSKSIGVGGTLENVILNSSKLYGQEARELEIDLSMYHQKKLLLNKGKAKSLPNLAAINAVNINSRLKKNNKHGGNTSEFINRGGRVLELENKEESSKILQRRKMRLRQLNIHSDDISKSQKSRQEDNESEIFKVNGEGAGKLPGIKKRNKYLHVSCKPQESTCKANGGSVEDLQGIKIRLRQRNKNLDESCKPQESQQNADYAEACKANGGIEEDLQGIKKRLRRRNKISGNICKRQECEQKDKDSDTFKANGESGKKLQGKKRRPHQRNKKSDDICKSQESQQESNEIDPAKANGKSKPRKLYSLEAWMSSPEFLALGEERN